ncbi:hypothetical protein BGZ65_008582 [Modicella reniformis]|uniref:Cysteine proteinase n=1 Tax=Modicella reniformis TaxID=1440133 RepID=A0A9P6LTY8_9FUNG|nr:hypothetical protein BGZ65_008582 [Modicella reniformis]
MSDQQSGQGFRNSQSDSERETAHDVTIRHDVDEGMDELCEDIDEHIQWDSLSIPNLVGQTTVGGQIAPDLDNKRLYVWFAFSVLSIRTEGVFKLRFSLFDLRQMNGTTTIPVICQIFSDPIHVQSPKKFLGTCAMDTEEGSKRGEREDDPFSDDDEAVHSTRSKRKKVNGSLGNAHSEVGGASTGRGSGLYLDTIQRYMLDFDFEKVCSVSLSNLNVYACLVCGKYFQVYILPDSYEVTDSSLDDIKYVLDPRFTPAQVEALDKSLSQSYDLNRKPYLPGFTGLNNVKANDYVNVVIQVLAHVPPIRNYFMLQNFDDRSELVKRFSTLVRKIWNPAAFKGQVSPHELLQEISNASNRKFRLTEQGDPLAFLSWFLNTLHRDLGGSKKKDSSIIYSTFQGEVLIESQPVDTKAPSGAALAFDPNNGKRIVLRSILSVTSTKSPFLFLALELPPPPLFHDELEKNIIPQVPLATVLSKYDGKTIQESVADLKRFQITRLPNYIILHIKRFSKNNFVEEKNPTIVTFPIKNLSMAEFVSDLEKEKTLGLYYDLVANITHEGDPATPGSASYKVHIQHRAKEQWYQIQDLFVEEINAQMIFLSESYIQVWERKKAV